VVLPLDAKAMPMLKLFQLGWGYTNIYAYYRDRLHGVKTRDCFIRHFETLVTQFEQQGVLFVETRFGQGFEPICDILVACKRL
jgi:hypothetical protein